MPTPREMVTNQAAIVAADSSLMAASIAPEAVEPVAPKQLTEEEVEKQRLEELREKLETKQGEMRRMNHEMRRMNHVLARPPGGAQGVGESAHEQAEPGGGWR